MLWSPLTSVRQSASPLHLYQTPKLLTPATLRFISRCALRKHLFRVQLVLAFQEREIFPRRDDIWKLRVGNQIVIR